MMELIDFATKSVLKKSNTSQINVKKVSFNDTVKLYIDDPNQSSKNENDCISQMKWVEISIVDKSHDSSVPDGSYEDCKVSDFLVHKVIYDDAVLPEDENDIDVQNEETGQECIVFESPIDEGLEFVVHKVTEHEDDLIEKELELDDGVSEEIENESTPGSEATEVVVKGLSELSVKNILAHDKIIAFIDQKNLCLPSLQKNMHILDNSEVPDYRTGSLTNVLPDKNINRLGLSPPLQELSLEKIVKAHSDNILAELDISPLNSVQETDSDSDLSSEGTMIMMTSEECEKNEQHIRESLLKYQSLKEKAKVSNSVPPMKSIDENSNEPENHLNVIRTDRNLECLDSDDALDLNPHSEKNDIVSHSSYLDVDIESSHQFCTLEQSTFDASEEPPPPKDCRSLSLSDVELLRSMCECQNSFDRHSDSPRKGSLGSNEFWDKSLTSVEIPKDVREWKILLNSFEKDVKRRLDPQDHYQEMEPKKQSELEEEYFDESDSSDSQGSAKLLGETKCDELESFVNENTERVERIRKRYLVNGKDHVKRQLFHNPHVRGIRPRFGSTAQILQLMQKQNNPPFYTYSGTKTHMSWPCDDAASDPEIGRNTKHKHSPHMYVSQSLSSDCSSQSSFDSDEHLNSSSDNFSISSCPSILMQERGRPEGASPPRPGAEECLEQSYDEGSDGFVYFSMKV